MRQLRGPDGSKHSAGRHFTTAGTIQAEEEVIRSVREGQGRAPQLMSIQDAIPLTEAHERLNDTQRRAIEQILTSHDQIQGLQGSAGSGKTVMLNAYNNKTDIAFCFFSEKEIAYDRRNQDEQRHMIYQQFEGEGWRTFELLDEMSRCNNFYFDQLCQIRMGSWAKGRVALVGDAAYCPSPAAGMGGSMAILGAAALADAFQKYPGDLSMAFQEYDKSFRPIVEAIQAYAIDFGLELVMPRSEEAIHRRNMQFNAG